MGIGDPAVPVADDIPANNPVPKTGDDATNDLERRTTTLENSGTAELARAVRWLYDFLGQTYPPP